MEDIDIEQINQWDATAFQLLYDHYYKALVSYALSFVGILSVSEDIVQEIFTRLYEHNNLFPNERVLRVYLYNAVRNSSLNYLNHNNVICNFNKEAIHNPEFQISDNGEENFFSEEVYRLLFQAIDKLPPRQREIFLMLMEGKHNAEIAEILNITIETVKTQKKRGMATLRKNLNNNYISLFLSLLI